MDRGAWQATVHGVAKSQAQLSNSTAAAFKFLVQRNLRTIPEESLNHSCYITTRLVSSRSHFIWMDLECYAESSQSEREK